MDKSHKTISSVTYLRAFAAILVLFGHCLNYYNYHIEYLPQHFQTLLALIYAVHVPTFFTVSGFLCRRQPVLSFYRKKVQRILVPFIFFSLLKILYSAIISDSFTHGENLLEQLSEAFLYGELYWFSYAILILFLFAPLLWALGRRGVLPVFFLLTGLILYIGCLYFSPYWFPSEFQIQMAVYYAPYFVAGYLLQLLPDAHDFLHRRKPLRVCLSLAVVLATIFYVESQGLDSVKDTFPVMIFVSFALMYFLYLLASILPEKLPLFQDISRFSYQEMLLDAFYRVILYTLLASHMNIHLVIPIFLADLIFCLMTCRIAVHIPGIRSFLGL